MKIDLNLKGKCNTSNKDIARNVQASTGYPRVVYQPPCFPPCAVVGGSPALSNNLDILRQWKGDIFAINETAAYLGQHGISSYLYMIDCAPERVSTHILIKGAVLASRCHLNQFAYENIRLYDMVEDHPFGVQGGPSAMARSPHLFLRMGYSGIGYFGCDSCFYDFSHITGTQKDALENLIIVRVNGIDYITNAALFMQVRHMEKVINKHKRYLKNYSGGLMKAIVENPEGWTVQAIAGTLRDQYGGDAKKIFNVPYKAERAKVWTPYEAENIRVA